LLWLYFHVTVNLVRSRRDLLLLVGTWLAGSALVAMTGIWGSLGFHLWRLRTPYALDTRAHGTFGDANFFSMHMGVSLLLALFYCRLGERRPWWAAPLAVLYLAAILLAASRSGFLALLAGLLVLPAFRTGLRTKLAVAVSALALAGLLALAPGTMDWIRSNPFTARLATTTLDPARTDRGALWANAWQAFLSSPVLGVGYGNAAYFDLRGGVRMSEAHNTYLGLLAETGIVGLGVYLAAILHFPVVLVRDARRARPPEPSGALPALVAAFVLVLAAGIPVNVENFRGLWILMGIAYSYRLHWCGSDSSRPGRTQAGGAGQQAGWAGAAGAD
jgi:O-antigen ligase